MDVQREGAWLVVGCTGPLRTELHRQSRLRTSTKYDALRRLRVGGGWVMAGTESGKVRRFVRSWSRI